MRYLTLVADYDGTLAEHDRIPEQTAEALRRLRISGRRAIMVTGRRLADLLRVCSCPELFDLIVAENGGVLYSPSARRTTIVTQPPPKALLQALRARRVEPLEIGDVIVATLESQRSAVQETLWQLGLEHQLIANRGSVMVLPPGVNKASGLALALRKLGLSRHEAVGIGDAENDHSFLQCCECAAAVANAVPSLKANVDFVTAGEGPQGVRELIDELIADDLVRLQDVLERDRILLGYGEDDRPVWVTPYGCNILVAGASASGKSTLTAGVVERLLEMDYQVCIVDPEGDYGTLEQVVALGNQLRAPSVSEILGILEDPKVNLSLNLLGVPLGDRSEFLAQLMPNLHALRARTGRPHWLVLDEAHHMAPPTWGPIERELPRQLGEVLVVTVQPEHISPTLLATVDIVVATGPDPERTLGEFARATKRDLAWPEYLAYQPGKVVVWFARAGQAPFPMTPQPGRAERIRHLRKYAEGDLRWHSFYFRGPHGKTNLKAHNLAIFSHLAQGIDEETWMFHLLRGDYSRWFRDAIRDAHLADEASRLERRDDLAPWQTRELIRELISSRYTLPE